MCKLKHINSCACVVENLLINKFEVETIDRCTIKGKGILGASPTDVITLQLLSCRIYKIFLWKKVGKSIGAKNVAHFFFFLQYL